MEQKIYNEYSDPYEWVSQDNRKYFTTLAQGLHIASTDYGNGFSETLEEEN
jgi:hypothetical protein